MSVKVILLLATAFLLAQCSLGKSVPHPEFSLSGDVIEQNPTIKVYRDLKKVQIFAKLLDLSGKVLPKLESGDHHDDEERTASLQSLSFHINSTEDLLLQGPDKISDKALAVFAEALINATKKYSPSDLLQLFAETAKFVEDFGVEVEEVWDNLSYQEQRQQKEFGNLLQHYQNTDDYITKFGILLLFIEDDKSDSSEEELSAEQKFLLFMIEETIKYLDDALKYLNEVSGYVFEDLWDEQDESISKKDRVAQIAQVSLLLKDLDPLQPQSALSDKLQFLATWLDFLQQKSTSQLVAKALLNRNMDPKQFVVIRFFKPLQEFGKDLKHFLSSLSPEEELEFERKVGPLQEFREKMNAFNFLLSLNYRYLERNANLF